MSETSTKLHIQKLDVLRGIAIILVFSIHSLQICTNGKYEVTEFKNGVIQLQGQPWKLIFITFFPLGYGWTGVQLFLLISGFLIHFSFIKTGESKLNLKSYFNKRFWRIYPPYLVVLLFFAFILYKQPITIDALLNLSKHIFMLHNLFDDTFYTYSPAFWSLALEFQLYLLYPILLIFKNRFAFKKVLYFLFGLYLFFVFLSLNLPLNSAWFVNIVFKNWFIWALGAYWAENYFNSKKTFSFGWPIIVAIGILFYASRAWVPLHAITDLIATIFYLTIFDRYLFFKKHNFNLIEKILVEIGLVSYSIYLIHQPLLSFFYKHLHIFGFSNQNSEFLFLDAMVVFGVIFLISKALYYVLEQPAIRFGQFFFKKYLSKI